jgi:hypothetical protein
MRIPNCGHLIKAWQKDPKAVTKVFLSRNISSIARRRLRRNLSGQAYNVSQLPMLDSYIPFPPLPPSLPTVSDRVRGKMREVDHELTHANLLADDFSSISLKQVQEYIVSQHAEDVAPLMEVVYWILCSGLPLTNDVSKRKRRWKISIYRQAGREQLKQQRAMPPTILSSIDMLCAELLVKEMQRNMLSKANILMLEKLSAQAQKGSAARTLRVIGEILTKGGHSEDAESGALLSMQEHQVIHQSMIGQWSLIWKQKEGIVKFLQKKKRRGALLRLGNSESHMDTILLKSLIDVHATLPHMRASRPSSKLHIHSQDKFLSDVEQLYTQIESIYGNVSDRWLTRLIITLSRTIEAGVWGRRTSQSFEDYRAQLPLMQWAQSKFELHCRRSTEKGKMAPIYLLHAMLDLEVSLSYHCSRLTENEVGQGVILGQVQEHSQNIKEITAMLIEHEKEHELKMKAQVTPDFYSTIKDAERRVKAIHTRIKLRLLQKNWKDAIESLQEMLDSIEPDECYHALLTTESMTALDKYRYTAKATLQMRRLMRATFAGIAVHLDDCTMDIKMTGCSALARMIKYSVERGVWDPWSLQVNANNLRHSTSTFRVQPVHAISDLSSLLSRLLGMTRPVRLPDKHRVGPEYHILEEGRASMTYWHIVQQYSESHIALKKRIDALERQDLPITTRTGYRWVERIMRSMFTRDVTLAAQCMFSLYANKGEAAMVLPRLQALLYDIFIPLQVPRRVWTSARKGLENVKKETAAATTPETQVWTIFNEAHSMGAKADNSAHHQTRAARHVGRARLVQRQVRW